MRGTGLKVKSMDMDFITIKRERLDIQELMKMIKSMDLELYTTQQMIK